MLPMDLHSNGGAGHPTDLRARRSFEHQRVLSDRVTTSNNQCQMRWKRLLKQFGIPHSPRDHAFNGWGSMCRCPICRKGPPLCFFNWYSDGNFRCTIGEYASTNHDATRDEVCITVREGVGIPTPVLRRRLLQTSTVDGPLVNQANSSHSLRRNHTLRNSGDISVICSFLAL